MSAKTSTPLVEDEIDAIPEGVVERSIELAFAFVRAEMANPDLNEQRIPNRASLALIPDDDPELAELAIQSGLRAVQRGRNMYFLHVTHDDDGALVVKWPEENPMSDEDDEEPQETDQGG